MLVDSHCHLNFKAYNDDLSAVIGRSSHMTVINIGAALDTSQKAVDIARANDNMYVAVGLHPIHVFDEEFNPADYQKLIDDNDKTIAIGETGFDYWHLDDVIAKGAKDFADIKATQEKVFRAHIKLAQANDLALVVHGRNGKNEPSCYQDILRVLVDTGSKQGVIHCFGGNLEDAQAFVDHGFHLGFTGIVTFDKTGRLEEIIKWIPLDKMLIETDAPYLTPVPHRGKRNEPAYTEFVAEKISEIKNMSKEEIIKVTGDNAIKLFNLK